MYGDPFGKLPPYDPPGELEITKEIEHIKLPVLNQQPPEKPTWDVTRYIEIEDAFWTFQGEGPSAGRPAVFIRLSGCNLQCPACDAIYTKVRKQVVPWDLVSYCKYLNKNNRFVVLTGGEPFRQNITPLVKALLNGGYEVEIETNGTYVLEGFPYSKVRIICSPKTPKIHPDVEHHIDCFKYVLDAEHVDPKDGLPTSVLGQNHPPARPTMEEIPIYVQPADEGDLEKNQKNLDAAVSSVMNYGYILSVQLNKLAGLP